MDKIHRVLFYKIAVFLLSMSVLLIYLGYAFGPAFPIDDAYISFRYAKNLANGFGLVFNPSEHVDGFSNFFFVVLIALFYKIGITPPLAAQIISLFSVAIIIIFFIKTEEKMKIQDGFARGGIIVAALLLVLSPHTVLNVHSGLESPLSAALLFAGFYFLHSRFSVIAPILFLLCCLTRPEIILLVLFVMTMDLFRFSRESEVSQYWIFSFENKFLVWITGFLIPYGLYIAWRWYYYGYPLPNSVYAKSGESLSQIFSNGTQYVFTFIALYWPLFLFLPMVVHGICKRRIMSFRYEGILAVLWIIMSNLYFGSADNYKHFHRYLYISLPFLAMFAALTINSIFSQRKTHRKKYTFTFFLSVSISFIIIIFQFVTFKNNIIIPNNRSNYSVAESVKSGLKQIFSQDYAPHIDSTVIDHVCLHYLADWFIKNSKPGESLATAEVGITPYYSGIKVIDTFGLVNKVIAHNPGPPGAKATPDDIFEQRPDYISMKVQSKCICGGILSDYKIMTDWRLRRDYDLVGALPYGHIRLLLFRRRDKPAFTVYFDFYKSFSFDHVYFLNSEGEFEQNDKMARSMIGNNSIASHWGEKTRAEILHKLDQLLLNHSVSPEADRFRKWLGNWKKLLYQHPLSNDLIPVIRYNLVIPQGAFLHFTIITDKQFWKPEYGDGIRYEISIENGDKSREKIFSQYVDPKNNESDRRWYEHSINLTKWWNRKICLEFSTLPGPQGDSANDSGGWGEPLLLLEPGKTEK